MSKNIGTLVQSTIRPLFNNSTIATVLANESQGGFQTVNNITERNNITTERRAFGMLVYVINADEFYQLKTISTLDVSDNSNWDLVSVGSYDTDWLKSVIARQGTPPGSPNTGDRYLVTGGTGSWSSFGDLVVEWNGSSWDFTLPVEGSMLRVDNEVNYLYSYDGGDYPSGTWSRNEFVNDPFNLRWNILSTETVTIGTESQYFIYGDLVLDGVINNYGQVVLLNGGLTGVGTLNNLGSGTFSQFYTLTNLIAGTGISVATVSNTVKNISLNLSAGSGISLTYSSGSVIISSNIGPTNSKTLKYVIGATESIIVPDYEEYFIYGDLTVYGTLDIGTYGKVVVTNGSFVAASGSVVNNMGNVEVYDLLTVADDNLKIDISEIKYGKSGRILYESELKYIPLLGTYARVLTENDDLVYSTSSAILTSTYSGSLDNYLGISIDDPQKKLHIRNSGLIIDGPNAEQDITLGNSNWSRLVIDTNATIVQDLVDIRNDEGRVLFLSAAIDGGNRYPSLSMGTFSTSNILTLGDYYGNTYLTLSRLGVLSLGTVSNDDSISKVLVWDSSTQNVKYRDEATITGSTLMTKSGSVLGASFSGTPSTVSVVFGSTFSSIGYSVVVTGEIPRTWSVEDKSISGFIINSNSNTSFTQSVFWQAMSYGETL